MDIQKTANFFIVSHYGPSSDMYEFNEAVSEKLSQGLKLVNVETILHNSATIERIAYLVNPNPRT